MIFFKILISATVFVGLMTIASYFDGQSRERYEAENPQFYACLKDVRMKFGNKICTRMQNGEQFYWDKYR